MKTMSRWLCLAALYPALLMAAPAEPVVNKQQCLATMHDLGIVHGFTRFCLQTLQQEAGSDKAATRVLNNLAASSACMFELSEADMADFKRQHPVVRMIEGKGQRDHSQADAEAFCREYRPELRRILRQYR